MLKETTIKTQSIVNNTDKAEAKQKSRDRKNVLSRITIGFLILLFISTSLYFLSKGISKAFHPRESNPVSVSAPQSNLIRATTEPDLNSPMVPVVSYYNIIHPSANQSSGRVLGESTSGVPEGSSYPSYNTQPSCPDYLGNTIACVQNPPGYRPTLYRQPTQPSYYRPTYYNYPTEYDSPYYQNSQEFSSGRCYDYLGDIFACLPPHYTIDGPRY